MSAPSARPGTARAGLVVAIVLVSAQGIDAQSGSAVSETPLQRAVRTSVQRASPDAFATPGALQAVDPGWDVVRGLAPGTRAEVFLRNAPAVRGEIVGATADAVTMRSSSGQRSLARAEISRITTPSRSRRMLFGMLGVASGAVAGWLACPQCGNEGSPEITATYVGVGMAAGAAAFLLSPSRTVYETPAP
jgi:hypothetical protein